MLFAAHTHASRIMKKYHASEKEREKEENFMSTFKQIVDLCVCYLIRYIMKST